MKLVLSGSSVSFIEKRLLGYKAPLYGRRTAALKLRPLRFVDALGFLRRFGPDDSVRVYSILGGTPAYLIHAYGAGSVREVVERILRPGSPLIDEVEWFLRQELREPRRYMALLRAFAEGRVTPYEAAVSAGVDPRSVHRYLEVLEELDIVMVRRPLGFRRGARVFFKDDYFRFWFTFVMPVRGLVEVGRSREAVQLVLRGLDRYVARSFERVVEESLPELHEIGIAPTRPVVHGPWWHRGEEIDIVVRDPRRSATFIEVKWRDVDLEEAEAILDRLSWKAAKTGIQEPENHYLLVARSIRGVDKPLTTLEPGKYAASFNELYTRL